MRRPVSWAAPPSWRHSKRRSPQPAEGRPAVVLVGGEAGVGKTRLVAELAARAEAAGVLVATGGCVELTAGTAPYLAFTEALRDLARAVGPRAWERMRAGAPPELASAAARRRAARPACDPTRRPRRGCSGRRTTCWPRRPRPRRCCSCSRTCTGPTARRSTSPPILARALRDERIALVATYRSDEAPRRPALRAGWPSSRAPTACGGSSSSRSARRRSPICWPRSSASRPTRHRRVDRAPLRRQRVPGRGAARRRRATTATLPASIRDLLGVRIAALPPPAQAVAARRRRGRRARRRRAARRRSSSCRLRARRRAARGRRAPPARRRSARRPARPSATSSCARRPTRSCCPASGGGCTPRARACSASGRSSAESPASAAAAVAHHWDAAGDAAQRAGRVPASRRRRRRRARAGGGARAVPSARSSCGTRSRTPSASPGWRGSTSLERAAETAVHAGDAGGRARRCSTRRSRSPIPPPSRCAPACCTRSAPGTRGPPAPRDRPCTSITPARSP